MWCNESKWSQNCYEAAVQNSKHCEKQQEYRQRLKECIKTYLNQLLTLHESNCCLVGPIRSELDLAVTNMNCDAQLEIQQSNS